MKAYMNGHNSYCNPTAAAGTSARLCVILDTALLAVSIFAVLIGILVAMV